MRGRLLFRRSAERSALITARQMEMIPVLGRDVQSVLRTLPGVRFDTSGDDVYNFLPGINGQGGGAATFAIDGLGGNDLGGPDFLTGPPNFDAVAEVKVLINSCQAEYGRSAGAMINVVTRSGTKDYRGSGYWYKRHEMGGPPAQRGPRAEGLGPIHVPDAAAD